MIEVDWVAAFLVEKKYVRKRVFEYCVQLIRIYRWRWNWVHVTENVSTFNKWLFNIWVECYLRSL